MQQGPASLQVKALAVSSLYSLLHSLEKRTFSLSTDRPSSYCVFPLLALNQIHELTAREEVGPVLSLKQLLDSLIKSAKACSQVAAYYLGRRLQVKGPGLLSLFGRRQLLVVWVSESFLWQCLVLPQVSYDFGKHVEVLGESLLQTVQEGSAGWSTSANEVLLPGGRSWVFGENHVAHELGKKGLRGLIELLVEGSVVLEFRLLGQAQLNHPLPVKCLTLLLQLLPYPAYPLEFVHLSEFFATADLRQRVLAKSELVNCEKRPLQLLKSLALGGRGQPQNRPEVEWYLQRQPVAQLDLFQLQVNCLIHLRTMNLRHSSLSCYFLSRQRASSLRIRANSPSPPSTICRIGFR